MRRTVKAWIEPRARMGDYSIWPERPAKSRTVFPCTITHDDGKPPRRAGKSKRAQPWEGGG
jgi:hypothetical protein